ncbi:MAG: DUF4340 domain-containing protein [Rhodospirillaceae bacterium]|nr:DUF4340 domain-containing protein [Rhodospirillaceae bacterium]
MNPKSFYTLCGLAAGAVALAAIAVGTQPSFEAPDAAGELVFPKLVSDINGLKTVTIRSKEGSYNLDWNGQGWTFRERDNYAVDEKKVNELVVRIARMSKLEAKTKVEASYERLDLNAPDAKAPDLKDWRAKQVTLIDKDGKPMADLIVGKRKFTLGSKEGGTYVRLPGDPQTWLALGELNPGDKPRDWLKRDVADIKDKDIKRVTVVHPDGEKVVVAKDKPEDTTFKIQNIPKGMEPTSDFVADEFGRVLTILLLDDVEKAGDVILPADKTIKAEFEGFEGFKVFVDYAELDGKNWIKVRGEAAASPEKPVEGTPAAESKTDWVKAMTELTQRGDGWVFEVPAYEVSALKKRMAEITKKPDPPEPKS